MIQPGQFFFNLIFTLILCSSAITLPAQEIFEDVNYEPGIIKYEGLANATTEDYASRAFAAIKNYHSKTAQELFDSILLIDKHNVLGMYGLAYCKFADGDYENSIEIVTPLININIKNAALFSLRARAYLALENLSKSVDDFKLAVELAGMDNDILSLSECHFYLGDFNSCIASAENYIAKNNQKPDGYFVKGLAKSELKDFAAANEELKKVTELDPENSNAFYYISKNFLELKETNKALKSINNAIEIDSKNAQAFDLRAELKYVNHDYSNSIIDCNKVIELDSETKYAYLTRGKSYVKLGLKKEACKDFKKSLELGNKAAEELIFKNCK